MPVSIGVNAPSNQPSIYLAAPILSTKKGFGASTPMPPDNAAAIHFEPTGPLKRLTETGGFAIEDRIRAPGGAAE
jgi:hypothetical protein